MLLVTFGVYFALLGLVAVEDFSLNNKGFSLKA